MAILRGNSRKNSSGAGGVGGSLPTLATMKPSRRWGTRLKKADQSFRLRLHSGLRQSGCALRRGFFRHG